MKRIKITLGLLVVGVLVVSGVVLAAANSPAGERVYVSTDNSVVKTMLGVRHEFSGGFSTEFSPQLKVLTSLKLIKTEPVQIYQITGKTDNPGEKSLKKRSPKKKPSKEETRTCTPNKQYPWGIAKVNGGSGGAGVKVAVLDTGVYKDHLDLKVNVVDCKDATKKGIKKGCIDNNGHGTHVSGTILANAGSDGLGIYGVAPEAKLMAIKVCGNSGMCWADDIATAIRYAADNKANIISMSLGGDTQSSLIKDAIDYATGKGVLIVAAAGNNGLSDGSIDYPGANVKVIAVGAIDSAEAVSDWSSRGINDGDYIIEEREVEFGAPGVAVESTYNNGCYASGDGTSMATPHVSGLAAKLWQDNAANTRIYLQDLAKTHDILPEGDDSATGFGLPIAP